MAANGAQDGEARARLRQDLLALRRMESAAVRADLDHPTVLGVQRYHRLRYLLSFAQLTTFQPGAAGSGRAGGRREVAVGDELDAFRARVADDLAGPLREERDPVRRLQSAALVLERLEAPLAEARAHVLERHGDELSQEELDAEVGTKVLVSVAGGGGGAGYVYIGAYQRLEEAGLIPAYVIGSSIGALMGLFRARARSADWDAYIELAKSLDRRRLFAPVSLRRRYGLPGLLALNLRETLAPLFSDADGSTLRLHDLEISFDAVVAGVRRRTFNRLPRRFRTGPDVTEAYEPESRRSPLRLAPVVASRMWQVGAFFDPRVTKPLVVGSDPLTESFDAIDAAGFSAAIPGVLHYDVTTTGEHMDLVCKELLEREEVAALVDGGVAANVPAELAWRQIQAGRLGTRNAFLLAFDCFHPKWDPAHLWLQPITQAVQLQMNRNAPFADWVVRFEPTLSPVNLVPEPERLDAAVDWGRADAERVLPFVERMLDPVRYEPAG
jgi:predicted acylesterase/phospholipase RssA